MKIQFKRIILFARQHRVNHGIKDTLCRLIAHLQQRDVAVFLDTASANFFDDIDLPTLGKASMGEKSDLIVVVGGDGSMLSAARMAAKVNVPVIGVNRGRLGFLTDICPQEVEAQLDKVLQGEFIEEQRFLLNTRICNSDNKVYFQSDALNDVVLMPGDEPHLIQFDLYINHQFVCHHRADGFIIATPTGSTAYALSAGGPILHPKLSAMVLVPMFSHSLSSRPIVLDADAKIELRINANNQHSPRVSCDGQQRRLIKPDQRILIQKSTKQLRLLHPLDHHYYTTLREKLGWEAKTVL